MKYHADAAFRIGSTHEVCEDYARAIAGAEGGACVAISDGCSSVPDTDIGARLLTLSALELWEVWSYSGSGIPYDEGFDLEPLAATVAIHARRDDLLPSSALHATLGMIWATGRGAELRLWGDGISGWEASGIWEVAVVRCKDDRPWYPIYALRDYPEANFSITEYLMKPEEGQEPKVIREQEWPGTCWKSSYRAGAVNTTTAFVGSDGWTSFVDADGAPVPVVDVLDELLPFRGTGPSFVRRRMAAFLRRAERLGWKNTDDISLAAIQRAGP